MKLLSVAFILSISLANASTTFKCKNAGATDFTMLTVDTSTAVFGETELVRDTTYRSGNSGKMYYRYIGEEMNLLVPNVMSKGKMNQGVIVVYTNNQKSLFACVK
jgi:hypothetical protein